MAELKSNDIKSVLFDFGGVIAEEGFREGLMAIAEAAGLPRRDFFEMATDAIYECGYLVGAATESHYWRLVRDRSGITGPDSELRAEILSRFLIRGWMIEMVRSLRSRGLVVGLLSDQTDWLDELDSDLGFIKEFDPVFNSYYLGKGKRDPSIFPEVAARMGLPHNAIVFVDDNPGHVERARSQGLRTILYRDKEQFLHDLGQLGLGSSAG